MNDIGAEITMISIEIDGVKTNQAKSAGILEESFDNKIHLPLTYICHLQPFISYPGSVIYSLLPWSG